MADVLCRWGCRAPVKVVSNGVNTTLFSHEQSGIDEEMRARYRIPLRNSLLFVGRLDEDKGVAALIRLLRMLSVSKDGHLIVCGSGTQDSLLRKAIGELGMDNRVSFTGWLVSAELSGIYRLASALVVVNRNDVQPLAVLEAFASGLPVVCLRTRNLEEIVVDGVNGFLAESVGQVYELARRLFDDNELRVRLGQSARKTAESRFSLEVATHEFLTCYRSLQGAH
jgi:glycosyltransferase involved in cell wall biosynthesis